jgi:hypothetical protein
MGKLEISVLIGAESKQFLSDLTSIVDRLERLSPKKAVATTSAQIDAENLEAEAPELKAAAGRKSKKAAPIEEQESFDFGEEEEAEPVVEKTPITFKEVVAACRERRDVAIKVLQTKFKVKSVKDLKPSQYASLMNEIGV